MKRFFMVALLVLGLFTVLAADPWVGEMKSTINNQVGQVSFDLSPNLEIGGSVTGTWEYGEQGGTMQSKCEQKYKLTNQSITYYRIVGYLVNRRGQIVGVLVQKVTVKLPDPKVNAFQNIMNFTSQIMDPNTGTGEWEFNDGSDKGIFELRAQ